MLYKLKVVFPQIALGRLVQFVTLSPSRFVSQAREVEDEISQKTNTNQLLLGKTLNGSNCPI